MAFYLKSTSEAEPKVWHYPIRVGKHLVPCGSYVLAHLPGIGEAACRIHSAFFDRKHVPEEKQMLLPPVGKEDTSTPCPAEGQVLSEEQEHERKINAPLRQLPEQYVCRCTRKNTSRQVSTCALACPTQECSATG